MPKPNPREPDLEPLRENSSSYDRKKPKPPSVGMGSVLLFWPFLIFHWVIRRLPGFLRIPIRVIGDCCIASVYGAVVLIVVYGLRAHAPWIDMGKVAEMPERTIIYDRHGSELGRIHGENRDVIRYDQISPWFISAILCREDARFDDHHGVDWKGVARAVFEDVRRGGMAQGASTLTMQLARNTYDLRLKPLSFSSKLQELDRKLLEAAVSYRIESNYKKEEILTHYVNRIFWGYSIRGIQEASRSYFEKDAHDLDLSESAMLAGIVRGPNAFSPFKDPNLAIRERDSTLDRMVVAGALNKEQAEEAKKEVINIRPEWRRVTHDTYPMDAIRRELDHILLKDNVISGGLVITTTIDSRLQKSAEMALEARLRQAERSPGYSHQTRAAWNQTPADQKSAPVYIQGSVVAVENLTGAILAIVGGRDADESKFNRAVQAQRQLGSIFKPFVYLTAFDHGMRPDTMVSDGALQPGEIKGAHNWHPHNSDGHFGGYNPASFGLIHSRNTMSIRVGDYAGLDNVRQMATDAGFAGTVPDKPSSYLGSWEATPVEVASAYTIFPNQGERYRPYLIDEIRDKEGNVLYKFPPVNFPTVSKAGSAWAISKILSEVTTSGTAAGLAGMGFTKPCAGKTGTTNDFKDAWFCGFTSSITCAVWVGLDKPERTIPGGYGATLALPIWAEVMKTADKWHYGMEGLKSKLSTTECRLCRVSGKRATAACEAAGEAYTDQVPNDSVPAKNDFCTFHTSAGSQGESGGDGGDPPKASAVDGTEGVPGPVPSRSKPVKAVPADDASGDAPPPRSKPVKAVPVDPP